MKKYARVISFILCCLFVISSVGCNQTVDKEQPPEPAESNDAANETETLFKSGTYTGISKGRNGPIVVQIDFSDDTIDDVRVISHRETYNVGDVPIKTYPKIIVENQSLDVDIVSGATISSVAFMEAVNQCVKEAGADPAQLKEPIPVTEKAEDTTADIVVIGGGSAGMTAAIYGANAGRKVILVEKLGFVGGTSAFSIESFGSSETSVHKGLGITATSEQNYESFVKANPKGDPEAFRILADNNGKAADWLKSIGAPLSVTNNPFSVTSNREAGPLGLVITSALAAEMKKAGVDIRVNTKATEIIMEDGKIAGVKVENPAGEYVIKSKAVIIASGGFAANNEMVSKYMPELKGYNSSCSIGAKGDGHLMAEALGAELWDMDYIRVNFTYYTDGIRYYYIGCLPNNGAIFVNNEGERFINDQAAYGAGKTVVDQGGTGWMIFDQSMIDSIEEVREYYELGLFESAPTIGELADKIGVNKDNLIATVEKYKGFVEKGVDEDFGRKMLNLTFDEAPFYACKMTCHVQGTFGGIKTDTNAQVLKTDGTIIPGLYAAGECASAGTYGANPAAVNIVFGKIAGENAAKYSE
jgi:fumarate reductase flavoprotein subunit